MRIIVESHESGIVRSVPEFLGRQLDDGEVEMLRRAEIVTPFVVSDSEDW